MFGFPFHLFGGNHRSEAEPGLDHPSEFLAVLASEAPSAGGLH